MERGVLDRELRAVLRRWSVIGGTSAAVLLVGASGLVIIGGVSAGTGGIAGMALLLAVVMVDSVVRLPRPAPYVMDGACIVPSSRLVGALVLLAGVAAGLLAVGLLTSDVTDQRASWARFAVPVVAAGLLLTGLVSTLRPIRLTVGLSSIAISGVRPRQIDWDDLTSVAVAVDPHTIKGSGGTALPLTLRSADGTIDLQTRWTDPTLWVIITWLEHYWDRPDDRGELAGPAGLARLEDTDARLREKAATSGPAWFPGPERT